MIYDTISIMVVAFCVAIVHKYLSALHACVIGSWLAAGLSLSTTVHATLQASVISAQRWLVDGMFGMMGR